MVHTCHFVSQFDQKMLRHHFLAKPVVTAYTCASASLSFSDSCVLDRTDSRAAPLRNTATVALAVHGLICPTAVCEDAHRALIFSSRAEEQSMSYKNEHVCIQSDFSGTKHVCREWAEILVFQESYNLVVSRFRCCSVLERFCILQIPFHTITQAISTQVLLRVVEFCPLREHVLCWCINLGEFGSPALW